MVNERKNTGIERSRLIQEKSNNLDEIERITCSKCYKIAKNAVQCGSCLKLQCLFCSKSEFRSRNLDKENIADIDKLSINESKIDCFCAKEDIRTEIDKGTKEILQKLQFTCENINCKEILSYSQVADHDLDCLFQVNLVLGNFAVKTTNQIKNLQTENIRLRNYMKIILILLIGSLIHNLLYHPKQQNTNDQLLNLKEESKMIKSYVYHKDYPSLNLLEAAQIKDITWSNGETIFVQNSRLGSTISTDILDNKNFKILLKIHKISGAITIGLTPHKIYDLNGIGFFSDSGENEFGLSLSNGKARFEERYLNYTEKDLFRSGDIVTLEKRDLSLYFYKNEKNLGLAIANLNNIGYYFTTYMAKQGDLIELLAIVYDE